MTAAVTREMSIVYGALTVGGTSDYHIDGKVRQEVSFPRYAIEFDVVVTAATASAFATACTAIEDAYRLPRQDLVWSLGGSTLRSLTTSAGTGFNHLPIIRKLGEDADTGRSRRYRCRVDVDLPADYLAVSRFGRDVDGEYEVEFEPNGRRRLRVTGGYTATSGQASAYTQATTALPTYVAALQTAVGGGGVWQNIASRVIPDDADKAARFEHLSHTLLINQSSGTRDHPAVVQSSIRVARNIEAPGDSLGTTQRLERISIRYSAVLDAAVSTSPSALFESTLRAWTLEYMQSETGATAIAIIDETVEPHGEENELAVSMTILAHRGGNVVESRDEMKVEELHGQIFVPVWDGNRYAARRYQGPALRTRRTTASRIEIGGGGGGGGGSGRFGPFGVQPGGTGLQGGLTAGGTRPGSPGVVVSFPDEGGGSGEDGGDAGPGIWEVIYSGSYSRPIVYGRPGAQISATERTTETLERYYEQPKSGGGGGGGGSGGEATIPPPPTSTTIPRNSQVGEPVPQFG